MQVTKCACATIEAAYTAHWLPTVRALTRHGLSCDDAQDVVTDAFVLLLERHARHNPPRLMCPWIHYTARALKATLALRHRYAALGLQHRYMSEVHSQAPEVDAALDTPIMVQKCLSMLKPRDRQLVWGRLALEKPYAELAASSGLSIQRVQQIVTQAAERMRKWARAMVE